MPLLKIKLVDTQSHCSDKHPSMHTHILDGWFPKVPYGSDQVWTTILKWCSGSDWVWPTFNENAEQKQIRSSGLIVVKATWRSFTRCTENHTCNRYRQAVSMVTIIAWHKLRPQLKTVSVSVRNWTSRQNDCQIWAGLCYYSLRLGWVWTVTRNLSHTNTYTHKHSHSSLVRWRLCCWVRPGPPPVCSASGPAGWIHLYCSHSGSRSALSSPQTCTKPVQN